MFNEIMIVLKNEIYSVECKYTHCNHLYIDNIIQDLLVQEYYRCILKVLKVLDAKKRDMYNIQCILYVYCIMYIQNTRLLTQNYVNIIVHCILEHIKCEIIVFIISSLELLIFLFFIIPVNKHYHLNAYPSCSKS